MWIERETYTTREREEGDRVIMRNRWGVRGSEGGRERKRRSGIKREKENDRARERVQSERKRARGRATESEYLCSYTLANRCSQVSSDRIDFFISLGD